MSTTVLEALQSAQINFQTLGSQGLNGNFVYDVAMDQLGNAIKALENDKSVNSVLQEHLFGEVNTAEKE